MATGVSENGHHDIRFSEDSQVGSTTLLSAAMFRFVLTHEEPSEARASIGERIVRLPHFAQRRRFQELAIEQTRPELRKVNGR